MLRRIVGLPPGHRNRKTDAYDYTITRERVACLSDMLGEPTRYAQRFVEQVSFVPTGGQRWTRTLQIQIPESAKSGGSSWWVLPLGQFKRRRFADLTVSNAVGARLNLLTRRQHGDALTELVTAKYVSAFTEEHMNKLEAASAQNNARILRSRIYQHFTTLGVPLKGQAPGNSRSITRIEEAYEALLTSLGITGTDHFRRTKTLSDEFTEAAKTTQYLCWITASPGEVINLQVSYTVADPKHKLNLGSLWDALKSFAMGLLPLPLDISTHARASWYRQYGLAPIDYEHAIPNHEQSGSYYLTLEPPPYTTCTYLDWKVDDSFNKYHEVDSAFPAVHIHNDEPREAAEQVSGELLEEPEISGKIRAYLRCAPHHHKQILGATALNVAVVWLLAKGELSAGLGEPLQGLIVAAPSILIAFLAQQQRHYYSHVMRRQRALLWIYLLISVTFLVAVAFSAQGDQTGAIGLSSWATVSAWILAISSAGVFAWHLPLGGSYERAVKYLTNRKWEMVEPPQKPSLHRLYINRTRGFWWGRHLWWDDKRSKAKWECYADAVRMYCNAICCLALILMVGAVFFLRVYGHFELEPAPTQPPGHAAFVNTKVPSPVGQTGG